MFQSVGKGIHNGTEITPLIDRTGVMAQETEKMHPFATFSKSLNPRNIEKRVSDILIRIGPDSYHL